MKKNYVSPYIYVQDIFPEFMLVQSPDDPKPEVSEENGSGGDLVREEEFVSRDDDMW